MQEAQVVGDFLFPADQEESRAVDPRMGSFDDPTPRFSAAACRPGGVFAFARNVGLGTLRRELGGKGRGRGDSPQKEPFSGAL